MRTGKVNIQLEYTETKKQVKSSIRIKKWKYVEDLGLILV